MNINCESRRIYTAARIALKAPRTGFTLVELLVVIAIIGILVGLLVPAVQSAVESGRRASCVNNLKQIGLATTQYETSNRQYPMNWGVVSTVGAPTSTVGSSVGLSWLTQILPYMDSRTLYDQIAIGQAMNSRGTLPTGVAYNNIAASQTMVKTFLCPSDTLTGLVANPSIDNGVGYGPTNYKACAGMNWTPTTGVPIAWTKGRNANSGDGIDHGNGVICRGGGTLVGTIPTNGAPPTLTAGLTQAPLTTQNVDIRDGASKTFLAGECVPAWCPWSLWMWFDGSTATCGMPMNYFRFLTPPDPLPNAINWKYSYSFMSKHVHGCNFAACDASVHFVSEQIDQNVYQALATIDGGEATVNSASNPGTTLPVEMP